MSRSDEHSDHRLSTEWIEVPRTTFEMGGGPRAEENPAHQVTVSAFRLARAPVTRSLFRSFLDDTGYSPPRYWSEARFSHPRAPAIAPSWNDAMAFCAWLSPRVDARLRLPTEAEWECAARAGRACEWPWGNAPPEELPDYADRWLEGPEPVDAYPSLHPSGFLGLGENVHEWCSDWYDADYYSSSPAVDPPGAAMGRRRSARGGSWRHAVKVTRCAARSSIPPDFQYNDFGFRLACDADS